MTKLEELFGISADLSFHENDLHQNVYLNLLTEVEEKSLQYFKSPYSNGGRSLETIYFNTWTGMVAEKYLIQEYGFKQDFGKYRDLEKNSRRAEIKTAANEESRNRILDKLQNVRKTKYENVIFFNRKGKQYRIESYYQYNFNEKKYVQIENYGVY